MGCCTWPLSLVYWITNLYSYKNNDMYDSSDEEPVSRFRYAHANANANANARTDTEQVKSRFKRTYDLRETKPVCYTEQEDVE